MNLLLGSTLHPLSRRRFAAIAFGAGAFILAACQGAGTGSQAIPSFLGALTKGNHAATNSPVYTFLSYTDGKANTQLTGINDDKNNVYVSGVTTTTAGYNSFVAAFSTPATGPSLGPPASDPPGAPKGSNIYISDLNDDSNGTNYTSVGFAPLFNSTYRCTAGTRTPICGVIYDPNRMPHLYQVQDGSVGTGKCAATYLHGTYDSDIHVGYYTKASTASGNLCVAHAIEEYNYRSPSGAIEPQFVRFQFPSTWSVNSSWAYGINLRGDVVGAYTNSSTANAPKIGWEYSNFSYFKIKVPNATSTQAFGINASESGQQVAGTYEDSTGGMHGFVTAGGGESYSYYSIDDPVGKATFINDINAQQVIVGWYESGGPSSLTGFVAACKHTTTVNSNHCPDGGSTGTGSAIRLRP